MCLSRLPFIHPSIHSLTHSFFRDILMCYSIYTRNVSQSNLTLIDCLINLKLRPVPVTIKLDDFTIFHTATFHLCYLSYLLRNSSSQLIFYSIWQPRIDYVHFAKKKKMKFGNDEKEGWSRGGLSLFIID
jgi:hypothetical protein